MMNMVLISTLSVPKVVKMFIVPSPKSLLEDYKES